MSQQYEHEQQMAIEAVCEAAQLCRKVQSQITPDTLQKKDRSPVTVADFGSQALICRALHESFPSDPIIAEEASAALRQPDNVLLLQRVTDLVTNHCPDATSDDVCKWIDFGGASDYSSRFWTLDPIDGTKGFLRGEQYVISLSLIVDGRIEVALLGCPNLSFDPDDSTNTGALFTAIRGQGAFVMPLSDTSLSMPIHVSNTSQTSAARFCESVESGHSSHGDAAAVASILNITAKPVRLDSQAKYAVVARGEADIYMRLPTSAEYIENIWDHAGGVLIVTEAGGTVTDITGNPLDFTHGSKLKINRGVIVTNTKLHQSVLNALTQIGVQ